MRTSALLVAGSLLAVAECSFFKWGRDDSFSWTPPKETPVVENPELAIIGPAPTEAPTPGDVGAELLKRQGGVDTCAYISGIPIACKTARPLGARCSGPSSSSHLVLWIARIRDRKLTGPQHPQSSAVAAHTATPT
jgi:hypothetical protein